MTAFFKRVIERYIMSNAGQVGKRGSASSGEHRLFCRLERERNSKSVENNNEFHHVKIIKIGSKYFDFYQ